MYTHSVSVYVNLGKSVDSAEAKKQTVSDKSFGKREGASVEKSVVFINPSFYTRKFAFYGKGNENFLCKILGYFVGFRYRKIP